MKRIFEYILAAFHERLVFTILVSPSSMKLQRRFRNCESELARESWQLLEIRLDSCRVPAVVTVESRMRIATSRGWIRYRLARCIADVIDEILSSRITRFVGRGTTVLGRLNRQIHRYNGVLPYHSRVRWSLPKLRDLETAPGTPVCSFCWSGISRTDEWG